MEDNVPNDLEIETTRSGVTPLNDADRVSAITPSGNDPADEIPVPIAMSAAEIDERAQAVEAVRGTTQDTTLTDSTDSTAQLDA